MQPMVVREPVAADALTAELVEGRAERGLVADRADDDVGVFLPRGKEGAGRLGDGVAGLDDLLGGGKVLADQDVHVRDLRP